MKYVVQVQVLYIFAWNYIDFGIPVWIQIKQEMCIRDRDSLAQILIDHIAKQNKVENPKDLENIGFFSVEEIFPNGNFLVDEDGITYTFNEYEIAAYVVRETNVFLPLSLLHISFHGQETVVS